MVVFLKLAQPCPLLLYIFGLFRQTKQFLQQINVKKCHVHPWSQDSNSQPLEHELSPMTTRPGLPPKMDGCLAHAALSKSTFIVVSRVQSPDSEKVFLSIIERKVLKLKK